MIHSARNGSAMRCLGPCARHQLLAHEALERALDAGGARQVVPAPVLAAERPAGLLGASA